MLSHLKRVEIELQNYCNRQCAWCPNTVYKRDKYQEMPEELFLKIIKELTEQNFQYKVTKTSANYVSFNRFSEPMFNIDLLKKRVNQAIAINSDLQYLINTNGDFLSREALDGLHLDKLNIMDYDNKGFEYWEKRLAELGVMIVSENRDTGNIVGIHNTIGKVNVEVDWAKNAQLENRAGFLGEDIFYEEDGEQHKLEWRNGKGRRYIECFEPMYYSSIDWNGNVMLCCHYRSDNPEHKDMILGNVKNNTLTEILTGEKAKYYQDLLGSDRYDDYPEGCQYCQKLRGVQVRADQNLNKIVHLKDFEK